MLRVSSLDSRCKISLDVHFPSVKKLHGTCITGFWCVCIYIYKDKTIFMKQFWNPKHTGSGKFFLVHLL